MHWISKSETQLRRKSALVIKLASLSMHISTVSSKSVAGIAAGCLARVDSYNAVCLAFYASTPPDVLVKRAD